MTDRVDDAVAIVAIDFGTTYSGYAYYFAGTPEQQIMMNKNWSDKSGADYFKAPTSVLTQVSEDGKSHKFIAFGFAAEQQYINRPHDESQAEKDRLCLFTKFKMQLYSSDRKTDLLTTKVWDKRKERQIDAKTIFAMALHYLKDHILDLFKIKGKKMSSKLIRWVLTVPAIWSERAKAFMRAAAFEGGLISEKHSDSLLIALEPEAASIVCRTVDVDSAEKSTSEFGIFPGTIYMVVDAGGGTIDITVHEVIDNDKLKEITRSTGGPHGGTNVDAAFYKKLHDVLGVDFITALQKKLPVVWLDIENRFEKSKRDAKPDSSMPLNVFSVGVPMSRLYEKMYSKDIFETVQGCGIHGICMTEEWAVSLSGDVVDILFEETITAITNYVENLLKQSELDKLSHIFLVGGFSASPYLTEAIRNKFKDRAEVVVPDNPSLVVLKGAVMFGQNPAYICQRIARKSFGCKIVAPFIRLIHKEEKRIKVKGTFYCDDVFNLFVKKNSKVEVNTPIVHTVYPITGSQTNVDVKIYESDLEDMYYVDDKDTHKIGEVDVPVAYGFMASWFEKKRPIDITFYFGMSELKMIVEDKSCKNGARETLRINID